MNVEDQLRKAITRQADRYEVPPPDIDGFAAGAMRRQRRHRTVAALAVCAVLGLVASGFVAGRSMWDTGGAGPADQPTSPTQESTATSSTDDRVGLVGPPPPGTPPTGPATGELVAAAELYNSGTWVYADGRIINSWHRGGTRDGFRGLVVRQLTPSGVEAMRSFLLDGTSRLTLVDDTGGSLIVRDGGRMMHAQDFEGCQANSQSASCSGFTDPEGWLPASAWEDPTFRPFVPHSYQICLYADDAPAEVLPAEAVDILGPGSLLADHRGELCRGAANPVARELADVMDQAVPAYLRLDCWGQILGYELPNKAFLTFQPVLPHGGTYFPCGG